MTNNMRLAWIAITAAGAAGLFAAHSAGDWIGPATVALVTASGLIALAPWRDRR